MCHAKGITGISTRCMIINRINWDLLNKNVPHYLKNQIKEPVVTGGTTSTWN